METNISVGHTPGNQLNVTLLRHHTPNVPHIPALRPVYVYEFPMSDEIADYACVSASLPSDHPSALVGHRNGFSRLDLQCGSCSMHSLEGPTDLLTAGWLQPRVGVFGFRNGRVMLWDFRCRKGVARLRHRGAVTHAARADDGGATVVVTGVPDSLALYDLRTEPARDDHVFSRSVWQADYRNAADIRLGFSLMGSVMAAAQDDGTLRVYSSKTGAVLKTFKEPRSDEETSSTFRAVKVIEDDLTAIQVLGVYNGQLLQYGV
jgi:hypothetical protein